MGGICICSPASVSHTLRGMIRQGGLRSPARWRPHCAISARLPATSWTFMLLKSVKGFDSSPTACWTWSASGAGTPSRHERASEITMRTRWRWGPRCGLWHPMTERTQNLFSAQKTYSKAPMAKIPESPQITAILLHFKSVEAFFYCPIQFLNQK